MLIESKFGEFDLSSLMYRANFFSQCSHIIFFILYLCAGLCLPSLSLPLIKMIELSRLLLFVLFHQIYCHVCFFKILLILLFMFIHSFFQILFVALFKDSSDSSLFLHFFVADHAVEVEAANELLKSAFYHYPEADFLSFAIPSSIPMKNYPLTSYFPLVKYFLIFSSSFSQAIFRKSILMLNWEMQKQEKKPNIGFLNVQEQMLDPKGLS